jgi:MFS family permease
MPQHHAGTGFYGWKLVAVVFVIYLVNVAFPYYGASVLNAFMAERLGLSRSALGFGFSFFLLFVGLSSPAVGVTVNRFGVRAVLAAGGVTLTAGALLMATVTSNAWHYYLFFGGICGLGFSLGGIIPTQSVVTYWFRRRKPLAMSIVLCASGVGSIIAIPLLNAVVSNAGGDWRAGWYVVAGACAAAAVIALLFVRNRPEDLGQHPDGAPVDPAEAASGDDSSAPQVYMSAHNWGVGEALRTRAYWLIIYCTSAFTMVYNLCIAHGVVHLRDRGIDDALTATSIGLVVMASVLGRLACGALGTRIEPRFTWCAGLVLMALGLQTLAIATASWHVYLYALTVGAGFGACYVSFATMLGNYYGTEAFAPLLGIITTVTCIVGALSPALAGVAYDWQGSYQLAFVVLLALTALAILAVVLSKPPLPEGPQQSAARS